VAQARGHGSVSGGIVREVKRGKHHTVWRTPAAGTLTDGRHRDGAPPEPICLSPRKPKPLQRLPFEDRSRATSHVTTEP
jgi:hypothetical protein